MIILKKQGITKTKYIDFKQQKKTIFQFTIIKNFIQILLKLIGLKLIKESPLEDLDSAYFAKNLNSKIENQLTDKISNKMSLFFQTCHLKIKNKNIIKKIIKDFNNAAKNFVIKSEKGNLGYLNSLKLYLFIRIFNPKNVVESGAFKGHSSYIISIASNNLTKIYSFDINLDNLIIKSKKVTFIEDDWKNIIDKKIKKKKKTLLFFDDHVSQVDRLLEANELGFKNIIFDDNYDLGSLYNDGWPAVPTIDMCFNKISYTERSLKWIKNKNFYRATWNKNRLKQCKNLIQLKIDFPSLYEETGIQPGSKMTYIKLK